MTALKTAIFIQGPQDPLEIYNTALQQIIFYDGRDACATDIGFHLKEEEEEREFIYVSPHENLPSLLTVCHRPGKEVMTQQEAEERLESGCGQPGCPAHRAIPAHLILAFSTDIHYTDKRGWNAGNLHSGLLWGVGGFLDSKKIPWKWQTNTDHQIHDGYEDLDDLVQTVQQYAEGPTGFMKIISDAIMKQFGMLPDEE